MAEHKFITMVRKKVREEQYAIIHLSNSQFEELWTPSGEGYMKINHVLFPLMEVNLKFLPS